MRWPMTGSKQRSCLMTQKRLVVCQLDLPQVVVTGVNRHRDDMKWLQFGRAMRKHCPALAIIHMAALLPTQVALRYA